jgi:hypothetical protein
MSTTDALQDFIEYLESEEVSEAFGKWLMDEDNVAFQYDFETWMNKKKEVQNE